MAKEEILQGAVAAVKRGDDLLTVLDDVFWMGENAERARLREEFEQPSQILVDLRAVYNGVVDSPSRETIKELYAEKGKDLVNELGAQEKAYRNSIARKAELDRLVEKAVYAKTADKNKSEGVDVGTEKALELTTKLLQRLSKEAKNAARS